MSLSNWLNRLSALADRFLEGLRKRSDNQIEKIAAWLDRLAEVLKVAFETLYRFLKDNFIKLLQVRPAKTPR